MKHIFQLPILAIVVCLAWLPVAQAQQSDASKVEDNGAADLEQLRRMADKGDQDAQYQLAERYRIGLMVERDHQKAIELYDLSAARGFASSQYRLGELYEEGEILERDLEKAVESYRKAAEQGHSGAQFALAHIYHLGSGVEQDIAIAIDWYRKAALQGDESSQLALGDQYRIGSAVPRDLAQSTKWYRRAAEHGNIFAQYELGNAYRYGNGVARDIPQAIEWYRLAADAGNPSAQLALKELEGGDIAAVSVTATADLKDTQDVGSQELSSALETDLIFWETAMQAVTAEKAVMQLPELEEVLQSASLTPPNGAAAAPAQMAFAASPSFSDEETVSYLLAQAEDQVVKLALTTPAGDNAYETYQQVLSLQPNNEDALDGIERVGVKYVELANLAAAKGDLQKTNHYAAKAEELAPEHPLVQAMTVPEEAVRPITVKTTRSPEILADFKALSEAPAALIEETPRIEVAVATSTSTTLEDLIENADDLIFNPTDYQGRQVAVRGPVVHLLWNYRLVAETGQNSIVIDIDGLSQADRDKLDAAIDKAGFLGQVRAQIKGSIERQGLATFELAATELALANVDPSEGKILDPSLGPDSDEADTLVVPVYPGEPFGQTNVNNNRNRSGDRGRASASAGNSGGGSSGGASSGGSGNSGGGSSGDSGGSGNGNSGNGNSGNGNSGNGNSGNGNSGRGDRDDRDDRGGDD